jgi:hypothetical protein
MPENLFFDFRGRTNKGALRFDAARSPVPYHGPTAVDDELIDLSAVAGAD